MIPGNAFTPVPIVGDYGAPTTDAYNPLTQVVWGGLALGDPSKGRLYQYWVVNYDGSNIQVGIQGQSPVLSLTVAGVTSVSLAFDTNMSPVVAYQTNSGGFLYYYDTISAQFTTRAFPNSKSSRVAVDQPKAFYSGDSDVIYAYTTTTSLCYRQQRDRYDTEYVIGALPHPASKILRLGLSSVNRLQFQLD